MTASAALPELAVHDWTKLIRGLTTAGATLPPASERTSAVAMVERMLKRAARDGAQALAWAGQPVQLARVIAGAGAQGRAAFAHSAELAACGGELPAGLLRVARAFDDDNDRRHALVAMFIEAGRRVEQLVEQLEFAAASEPSVEDAARKLASALPRAQLRQFRPRGAADFDRVRAVDYAALGKPGHILEIRRPGLAWHGCVLRKADVVVAVNGEQVVRFPTIRSGGRS